MNSFVRALRTPELRAKILFTLGLLAIYRLGVFVPTPGFDYTNVMICSDQASSGQGASAMGMINMFSGGALLQLSVFSLGVMPYITASIIVQLLRVVIPRFEALHKEGASGTAKLTQYTRYLTIGLGVLQATTIITLVRSGNFFVGCNLPLVPDQSIPTLLLMVLAMTVGTVLIMFMGEMITERGIGNGMSLMIFTSIAASFPGALTQVFQLQGWMVFALVLLVALVVMVGVVFVEQSQRRIPVQYAKRMVGRRMYGGTSTYIPIKVNQAGVIPVIFASSILSLPQMLAGFGDPEAPWVAWINQNLVMGSSFSLIYALSYSALIIFFAFFYTSITFNAEEIADNMKKYGGFVPNVRAGKPTERYLRYVINRIQTPGALYLAVISLMPLLALTFLGASQDFPLGGVSLLIIIGVGLDTVKQIDAKLQQHHYEGILR
ncbi:MULTISPECIES: preprotein translocase subunit SecY [Brachybacterium]|uniref:Protein translocase subunit SecY n=1 Tax=Brachybacterium alimentarium TaxID=47845 RepID=A0A2A3YM69_9MICO|nr:MULTISPECIES: preprotein translocase subunit SecY [Brachybacterium]PCC35885.1 preprotein translocase subunit SecY [Brachybacterium alimentarium]PCC40383.1 preprotein translocase subunit SecY [Brachybacterium alimentarium]RCS63465.1 preprotein translocase subunit SecY [Brachybacterium sp. JB7]RCS67755.1 preprotein translocase subunit SecY [Brachybacterium alimentarium]RCS68137.1 preprotein translocase subunit SecY [Brachybacterium alimentarium]